MPFVKLPPLSPELHALMLEVRAALEGAEVGKPAPMPPGLMQRIEDRMREEALARRRLEWLHSSESSNVDGWEWGIYRLRWLNNGAGSVAEVQQTLNDFSDLDAAMANHSGVTPTSAPQPTLRHNERLCADCTTENACQNRLDLPRPCWTASGVLVSNGGRQ